MYSLTPEKIFCLHSRQENGKSKNFLHHHIATFSSVVIRVWFQCVCWGSCVFGRGSPPYVLFLGRDGFSLSGFNCCVFLVLPIWESSGDVHTTHGGSTTYSRTYRQEAGKRMKERSPAGTSELFSSSFSKWQDGLSHTT